MACFRALGARAQKVSGGLSRLRISDCALRTTLRPSCCAINDFPWNELCARDFDGEFDLRSRCAWGGFVHTDRLWIAQCIWRALQHIWLNTSGSGSRGGKNVPPKSMHTYMCSCSQLCFKLADAVPAL